MRDSGRVVRERQWKGCEGEKEGKGEEEGGGGDRQRGGGGGVVVSERKSKGTRGRVDVMGIL